MVRERARCGTTLLTARTSRSSLRVVGRSCLSLAIGVLLNISACPPGAHAYAEHTRHVFRLQYTEDGFSLRVPIRLERREVIFKKEPGFSTRSIVRGALPVGPEQSDFIGFAYDREQEKLHIDLNRNLDLTDDASGIFEGKDGWFKNVQFEIERGPVRIPYVIDMAIGTRLRGRVLCVAFVRSGWQAEIELGGKKRWFALQDNMDGQLGGVNDSLIIRSAGESFPDVPDYALAEGLQIPPSEILIAPDRLPVPERLSFDGHCYNLAFAFQPGESATDLKATFTESDMEMSEVKVDGQLIKRLILREEGTDDSSLVILDEPTGTVTVPIGTYYAEVYLDSGSPRALFRAYRYDSVLVAANKPTRLRIGGPLSHRLAVNRRANALELRYLLTGSGGETYTDLEGNPEDAPTFAVYKKDQKIAGGTFEYG